MPLQDFSGPVRFDLHATPESEIWTRHFPGRTMRSTLCEVHGHLEEHLGPIRMRFELVATPECLDMRIASLRILGLPCPAFLMPRIDANERGDGMRFHFDVSARLPLIGEVARYRGFLALDGMDGATPP